MNRLVGTLALFTLSIAFIGCGGTSLNPVTGKALYKEQPMAGGTIIFNPKGQEDSLTAIKPSAGIKDDGSFSLMTDGKEGAPAGKYVATFAWSGPPKKPNEGLKMLKGMGGDSEDRSTKIGGFLPEQYTNPKLSTVEVEIQSGSNAIPTIHLK